MNPVVRLGAQLRHAVRAYPSMLRVGLAEAVAYRAEFIVWMLTTTVPLVMLALWTAVAREAPAGTSVSGFRAPDFVAYYLAALIIRTLTGSWVVWEMNQEIRTGTLSMRLLRPIHPFFAYSAEHLAAVPLRAILAVPIAVVMLVATGGGRIVHDPVQIAILPVAIAGAWIITFVNMAIIGTLGLLIEKSISLFDLYMAGFAVLSGYLVPLALMPHWVARLAGMLPFPYMLSFPTELMIGRLGRADALGALGIQWAWVLGLCVVASMIWKAGVRRFEAFGA